MTEYWAAVDSDGWEWLFEGEPLVISRDGVWDQGEDVDVLCRCLSELACRDVSLSCKRKLSALDIVTGTVEYEGDEIHG